MTDRPINCKPWEVRALLDGRKTMTRLIFTRDKEPPPGWDGKYGFSALTPARHVEMRGWSKETGPISRFAKMRFAPNDRLWVRESFRETEGGVIRDGGGGQMDYIEPSVEYMADGIPSGRRWTPSIHMPRWASRLTLIVTATKIERLQDITSADAIAEGIERIPARTLARWRDYSGDTNAWFVDPRQSFDSLWRSLHGPKLWAANPEVVALAFRVIKANIDSAEARAA